MGGATQSIDLGTNMGVVGNPPPTPGNIVAQGTGTILSGTLDTKGHVGCKVVVNITAITAGSLTVIVEGFDTASNTWFPILTSAALAAVAETVLTVYPGVTAVANVAVSDALPQPFRIRMVIATGPVTATVALHLLA